MSLSVGNASYDAFEYGNLTYNTSLFDAYIDMFLPSDFERILINYIIPVVVAFGIVGNIMTFIVMVSKLHTTVYVYLANLAIADTMNLIIGPSKIWISEDLIPVNYTIDEMEINNFECGLFDYFSNCALHAGVLTIVGLSIERYMAVCRPFQFKTSRFGTSRSVKMCVVIWIFCFSVNTVAFVYAIRESIILPWPDMYRGISNRATICGYNPSYNTLCTILWILNLTVNMLLIISMVILYSLMLYSIRKSRKKVSNSRENDPHSKSERKIFWTVFVTVAVYVILVQPLYLFGILYFFNILGSGNSLFLNICRFLTYLNSSVNPLIYNVVNDGFRREFVDVFYRRIRTRLIR
ncbi:delta-type opioid receptor-like [Antedon mediterranea]|uniref:delta-type opioid receptor-like n=1 Tax=Antedon mediterranea TaxID=105859 RepID=UPI003AF4FA69